MIHSSQLFSAGSAFTLDSEQMLLCVAANQAGLALQRWRSEQRLTERAIEVADVPNRPTAHPG
jgi:hypothetical protein